MPLSPRLSVIMPTYNRGAVIRIAIDSILAQTFSDFEFIIVDDSSTDDTSKILLEYASRENRIIILRQEKNQGPAAARNLGAGKAQGKYIAFMDDDDVSLPLRLEKQVAFLDDNPKYQACTCYLKRVVNVHQMLEPYKTSESPHHNKRGGKIDFISSSPPHSTNIKLHFGLDASTTFTKESFIACGGHRTSDKIAEDTDFTFIFLEKFHAARLMEALYCYNVPESDFGNNVSTRSLFILIKRQIVSHISAWYRLTNQPDPVEGDLSLDEAHQLIHQLPPKTRLVIYAGVVYMHVYVQQLNKCSRKESVRYIMEMAGVTKLPILLRWKVHFVNYKLRYFEKLKEHFIGQFIKKILKYKKYKFK